MLTVSRELTLNWPKEANALSSLPSSHEVDLQ